MIHPASSIQETAVSPARFTRKTVLSLALNAMAAVLLTGAVVLIPGESAWAKTTIKILSPENGAVVSQKVSVNYAYHKEGRADHVHVFVDGNFLKATHKDPVTLTLDKGQHTIMIRAASAHHNLLRARASVDVTVK
jgi:hypothetical protein